MRIINFRAWDSENNRMVYGGEDGYSLQWSNGEFTLGYESEIKDNLVNGEHVQKTLWKEVEEFYVMQSSGYTEAGGEYEVYEGDIVEQEMWYDGKSLGDQLGVIEFSAWDGFQVNYAGLRCRLSGNVRIVGNIYEHKKLLTK